MYFYIPGTVKNSFEWKGNELKTYRGPDLEAIMWL